MNPKLKPILIEAIAKLDAQGARSTSPSTGCAYRGQNGTCCFVGHMISDEHYDRKLEGFSFYSNAEVRGAENVVKAVESSIGFSITKIERRLINLLQNVHDIVWNPESETFSEAIARFRKSHNEFNHLLTEAEL
ncbi:MAG: hypothetical protein LPK02_07100 [Rhodobacterales bacterium]|nr:hypothetical protein [Rhodobacterales bacterium]